MEAFELWICCSEQGSKQGSEESGDQKRTDQAPEGNKPSGLTHSDVLGILKDQSVKHGQLLPLLIAAAGGGGLQDRLYVEQMGFDDASRTLKLANTKMEYGMPYKPM